MTPTAATDRARDARVFRAVLIAALGYFVDIYDLILFSIIRVKSLRGLGVPEAEMLDRGVLLLDMQMGGMLVGGVLWGILGDKRGRLSVLFGSIFMYSAANLLNGFVESVPVYAALRFIAGIGLAGELGAGITLVSELMPRRSRGYGTTIVATVGILGGLVAVAVGDRFDWRAAYFVGGGLGLALLALRVGVSESSLFDVVRRSDVSRGRFLSLFRDRKRALRYAASLMTGVPIWYVVGILITFSPELGRTLGMGVVPDAGRAVMFCYIGLASGDLASGLLSQWAKSRKRVVAGFLSLTALGITAYFTIAPLGLFAFYSVCLILGLGIGYWAVFITMAAEQFGTNIRATVTTTAPNFVRGAVVPLTALFQLGKPMVGVWQSALAVGLLCLLASALSLARLDETFGRDLDFVET